MLFVGPSAKVGGVGETPPGIGTFSIVDLVKYEVMLSLLDGVGCSGRRCRMRVSVRAPLKEFVLTLAPATDAPSQHSEQAAVTAAATAAAVKAVLEVMVAVADWGRHHSRYCNYRQEHKDRCYLPHI